MSNPAQTTILIIHADTYTGAYIGHALVGDPAVRLKVSARRIESVTSLVNAGAEFVQLREVPKPEDLDAAYGDADTVILAPSPTPNLANHVQAHLDTAVRIARVRHLVLMSVVRADRGYPTADPWATYDALEANVRRAAETHRPMPLAATVVRVGYVQQNLVYLSELVRARAVLPLPLGGTGARTAPVNLKDVAAAVAAMVIPGPRRDRALGQTYALTGPTAFSGEDMARVASVQFGVEIKYIDVKDASMRQILHTLPGITETEVDAYMAMYQDIRDGYHDKVSEDLNQFLNRAPESLAQFFHENASQFRPEGGVAAPIEPVAVVTTKQSPSPSTE
ncbi:hypothetical protein H9P43_007989 [Blastocladiella emersonii ATCC 22665]|nr:hypothetical protein H9P43_007989 [Blastocladiella emersonii ATCC 22665]